MLDIRFIRDNAELVSEASKRKGYEVDIKKLLDLDEQRRDLQTRVDVLRSERNENASKMQDGQPDQTVIDAGKRLKVELAEREGYLKGVEDEFTELLKQVPNLPLKDVPLGESEADNVVAKTVGSPKKFDFDPKTHSDIAEAKGWLDKVRAAKVTGARFAYLKGDMVKLQFAIIQFVMDKLTDQTFIDDVITENKLTVSNKPFMPVLPPFMLRTEMFDAMDRLEPSEDRYKIEGEDLWLQGSAEHVLGSMHADEIFFEKELPLRYVGYATSFRREAGSYGKDMDGIFRMHQFDKLEMESMTVGEAGLQEHLFLIAIQEKLMQLLDIPYEVIQKCIVDIGKPNARGIDINAWIPTQATYRETHTADYMTDYQARRLKTRVDRGNGKIELVHTNDATAVPLSRVPIAIIENYQTKDGDVTIPDVLRPYLGNRSVL